MMEIKILVLEDDLFYAEALVRQLALKNKDFTVTQWRWGSLEEKDAARFDLLIAGERQDERKEFEERAEKMITTFAEKGCCVYLRREPEVGREPSFFRYGRISELAALLRITYAAVFGKAQSALDHSGRTRLSGFLSGAGGTGKTAAALTCCRLLSREHEKRVLYLSFEEWNSAEFYVPPPNREKALGDYLYYLYSAGEETMASWLAAYLYQDACGVFYFFPPAVRNELLTLSEEELIRLFKTLFRYGEFDHIVMDLPGVLSDQIVFLLRSCSQLVLVTDSRAHSSFRTRRMKMWLTEWAGFSEEEICVMETEWEEGNVMECENGAEVDIHLRLGREVTPVAEWLAE